MNKSVAATPPNLAGPTGPEIMKVVMNRPARKQLQKRAGPQRSKPDDNTPGAMKGDGGYNIWYNKWSGDRDKTRVKMTTRCRLMDDAGRTKADQSQNQEVSFICLHFARGDCSMGAECSFFHKIPDAEYDSRLPSARDCFGRDRFATDRDDMGGVGGILKDSLTQRTLYVGGLPYGQTDHAHVRKYFGVPLMSFGTHLHTESSPTSYISEWGEIDRIHILRKKGVAFVTYVYRSQAEFAKEAMDRQSLAPDGEGMLNCRWATEDSNPVRREATKRAFEEALLEAHHERYGKDYLTAETADATEESFARTGPIAPYPGVELPPELREDNGQGIDTTKKLPPKAVAHVGLWSAYPSMVPDDLLLDAQRRIANPSSATTHRQAHNAAQYEERMVQEHLLEQQRQDEALMQQALAEMNGSSHVQHGSEVAPQKTVSEADYYASPYAALSASIQHSAKRFRIDKEDAIASNRTHVPVNKDAHNIVENVVNPLAGLGSYGGDSDEDSD